MRVAALREQLVAREPAEAAWLLDALATAGRAGGPPYDVSLLAAIELAGSDRLPYETRRAIYEAADRLGLASCRELLYSTDAAALDEDAAAPRALTPGTRPLTAEFDLSAAFEWLQANAGSYGFRMPYDRGNRFGFEYEPWHWSQVDTQERRRKTDGARLTTPQ